LPSAVPAARVPPAEVPGVQGLTTLLVGVVVVAALYLGREVLIPITVAILLSFVLAPLVGLLRRLRAGRVTSVILAVVISLGVVLGLGGVIGTQVAELASDLPSYQWTIERKIDTVRRFAVEHTPGVLRSLGPAVKQEGSHQTPATPAASAGQPAEPPPVPVQVVAPGPTPLQLVERIFAPIVSPLATAGIIFVVAIFILLQQEDLRDRLIRLFGSSDLHRTTMAMDDAAKRLSRYFLLQLGINAGFGVVIGTGLLIIGVPSPVLWGVLAALMRFVPYVGTWIAAALPLALGAAIASGWSTMLEVLGLFALSELITGQAIEPHLYGRSTGLSPVAVVVSAIFWGWLWGLIGLILSTPLTLCLIVLGRHVERLEFLDVMFGDRPALTPIENFYQRALAGDSDEALEQAELLLKNRSLSSYYDEVVRKGLQLAANDLLRGVLTALQLERIKTVIQDLAEGLDDYPDADPVSSDDKAVLDAPGDQRALPRQPAPDVAVPEAAERAPEWQGEVPVLCVAGRGPFDEAVSFMLAQLLRKHAVGARVVPHEAVSRAAIHQLDTTGVALVCISYLEITGTPSLLRYLIRRLQRHMPNAPIVVGLWADGDAVLTDPALQTALAATHCAMSLRDMVNACLETLQAASSTPPLPVAVEAAAPLEMLGQGDAGSTPKLARAEPSQDPPEPGDPVRRVREVAVSSAARPSGRRG
jgi:predicted PurR-regulated permease PerM